MAAEGMQKGWLKKVLQKAPNEFRFGTKRSLCMSLANSSQKKPEDLNPEGADQGFVVTFCGLVRPGILLVPDPLGPVCWGVSTHTSARIMPFPSCLTPSDFLHLQLEKNFLHFVSFV